MDQADKLELIDYLYNTNIGVRADPMYHLSRQQRIFNEFAKVPCYGMRYMRDYLGRKGTRWCRHPMCPTCWHVSVVSDFLGSVKDLSFPDRPYWCIRKTMTYNFREKIPESVLTAFHAKDTIFKKHFWTLTFDTCSPDGIDPQFPERDQELEYGLVGVFSTKAPVSAVRRGSRYQGSTSDTKVAVMDEKGEQMGQIERIDCQEPDWVFDMLPEHIKPAWVAFTHTELLEDYIGLPWPTVFGKLWTSYPSRPVGLSGPNH